MRKVTPILIVILLMTTTLAGCLENNVEENNYSSEIEDEITLLKGRIDALDDDLNSSIIQLKDIENNLLDSNELLLSYTRNETIRQSIIEVSGFSQNMGCFAAYNSSISNSNYYNVSYSLSYYSKEKYRKVRLTTLDTISQYDSHGNIHNASMESSGVLKNSITNFNSGYYGNSTPEWVLVDPIQVFDQYILIRLNVYAETYEGDWGEFIAYRACWYFEF